MTKATASRQWRFYKTESGRTPVKDFLAKCSEEDAAEIVAGMKDIQKLGLKAARHLRKDIYEVRIDGRDVIYRVLFAKEGRYGQVLLSLHAFKKKAQKTPQKEIDTAEQRLKDWRSRAKT